MLLAAGLFVAAADGAGAEAAAGTGAEAEAGIGTGTETGAPPRLTYSGKPMLDPGFGYYTHFTSALAEQLYKESPVTAYLPTRLPDSGWQYYGMQSQLTADGYELTAYRLAKPAETRLLAAGDQAGVQPETADVLYRLKAGKASEAGLAVPTSAKQLASSGAGWKFWGDGVGAELSKQLSDKFASMIKPGAPVSGSTGTVLVSSSVAGKVTYSASWTNDDSTYYSFVSYGSLDDFASMLTSFRPVLNLLDSADIVLLPVDMQLNLQAGRDEMFKPFENKFVPLAQAPFVKEGIAYLPLRDIAHIIGGEIQFVAADGAGGAVYVSQNGWLNELKLQLRTGEVFRNKEKVATVPLVVKDGTTLVPLRFMTEQFGLPVSYDSAAKSITVHYSHWATNSIVPPVSSTADYQTSVLSIGGPPFTYYNERLGPGTGWSYEQQKPPVGYNSLKYQLYKVGVHLVPGENAFVLRDMQTKRVINSIPLQTTIKAADVPFRTDGSIFTDNVKVEMKLTSSNGKVWPNGYAEMSNGAAIDIAGEIKGMGFDSVQIGYRVGSLESKLVSIPVKDGKFTYQLTPNKEPGTYVVTLYSPPGSVPGFSGSWSTLVSYVVVVI
ncbi:Copper amine oxidase N-terminal domain-containing protein [Paenibacillus sp. OV219]|nr:Copper amine oxidase N-terminal domain-containing protein [Paenibacillus sp. OV219]